MTVHSTQLGAHAAVTTGGSTIYTVPSNTRTILKSLWFNNTNAAAQNVSVIIALVGGSNLTFKFPLAAPPAAGQLLYLPLWVVMNVGDAIKVFPGSNGVDVIASGAELSTV